MTMKRDECLRALARHVRDDDIVVAVFTTAFEWIAIRPSPLNYIMVGAMGLGSSHALGLAFGRPDRRIIVLDGDGSLLMNLGALVTVASAAPENLFHFVVENGTYEANGSHPIPGRDRVDFAGLTTSAGYRHAATFDDLSDFESSVGKFFDRKGPVFATLKVVPGEAPRFDYQHMHGTEVRQEFRRALAAHPPPT
jgi:thiamine pyrophosphate-dependent acetolactate synthase large subunit-like protein